MLQQLLVYADKICFVLYYISILSPLVWKMVKKNVQYIDKVEAVKCGHWVVYFLFFFKYFILSIFGPEEGGNENTMMNKHVRMSP